MYKVTVNGREYQVAYDARHQSVNGQEMQPDILEYRKGKFHLLHKGRSYEAELIEANFEEKSFSIKVNHTVYQLNVRDKYDDLLREMGIDITAGKKVNDIKAPMPGLVLNVAVAEGQAIKKGDPILVLEAMKMENVIKAPADGAIRKISVNKGDKVEKNQVMVSLH